MRTTNPDIPIDTVSAEVIERSIEQIAASMRQLDSTRLSRKAIVTLIHANSKVNKRDIELVLNNLTYLEQEWLKPKPKSA